MKDYSQSNEQAIILKYFGDYRGTFLDAGANDGATLSNTRALAELGWQGVLIEPSPTAFAKLSAIYQSYIPVHDSTDLDLAPFGTLVNAAITLQDGPIDFYDSGTHLNKGDTSLLSTTRPEEMARWKKSGETFTKTTVRGITFKTLVKETGLTRADFVSIDVEGADLDVLRQIDLTAFGTRMVCVEVNRADQKPFDEYCAKHGLRLLHRNFENAIYTK
jgi:FkbM family methyltransferase